jgi:hypothetical protein
VERRPPRGSRSSRPRDPAVTEASPMWQTQSGQQKSLVGQIDAIMAGGTPGKVRTCDLRFRRRCSGISPNPLIHAPLPVYPHEYWLAIGSLILTRCPPSAAISIQITTIYPQATHKIFRVPGGRGWGQGVALDSQNKNPLSLGVSLPLRPCTTLSQTCLRCPASCAVRVQGERFPLAQKEDPLGLRGGTIKNKK